MKKCTSIVMALIAMVLLLTGCPHPVSGDEPDVMVLTLDYSGLSNKDAVKTVKVQYGWAGNDAGDEHYAPEVTATISGYKATVECDKTYAKTSEDWVGFDHTKIKLLDASGNAIACRWNADWFEYDEDGVTLTASDVVSEKAILTLTFTGFEIPGGSVSVHYGADDGTYVDTTATVAEDGKSATVLLDKQYANNAGWFNKMVFTVTDESGNEVSNVTYTKYCEFQSSGMSLTLVVDTDTYTTLFTSTSLSGSLTEIVSVNTLSSLSIKKLKVQFIASADSGWATITSSASDWDANKIELKNFWDESIRGYSTVITDADAIASYKANGIYLAGADGTVTVSYVAAN